MTTSHTNPGRARTDLQTLLPGRPDAFIEAILEARSRYTRFKLLNVRPDAVDQRDVVFQPQLHDIPETLDMPGLLRAAPEEQAALRRRLIRRQGIEGSCTGHAVANLVDLQRLFRMTGDRRLSLRDIPPDLLMRWSAERTSARMLYEMARAFDDDPEDRIPGASLRNVLKALDQNGACAETLAPYEEGEVGWSLTLEQARQARSNSLGLYMRVRNSLYDYHSALAETGVIVVSAMIHDGWFWDRAEVAANGVGVGDDNVWPIRYDGQQQLRGGHAFVIVGYSPTGFYVLNSFGWTWGLWSGDDGSGRGVPGVAHWSYSDWRDNILDGWVIRLAISSPAAFRLTDAGYGQWLNPLTGRKADVAPRLAINGHYVNLKMGSYITTGRFPNTTKSFEETATFLRGRIDDADGYKRLALIFLSGQQTLEDNANRVAALVDRFKEKRVYPVFIAWPYALLSQLEQLIAVGDMDARRRAGEDHELRRRLLERYLQQYGDMYWDKLHKCLDATVGRKPRSMPKNADFDLFRALLPISTTFLEHPRGAIHFVAHSDGALLLDRFIGGLGARRLALHPGSAGDLDRALRSVSLIAPLSLRDELGHCESVARAGHRRGQKRAATSIFTLSENDELSDRVGEYAGTLPLLAQNLFVPGQSSERILGLHQNAAELARSPYYVHHICAGLPETRNHFAMLGNADVIDKIIACAAL